MCIWAQNEHLIKREPIKTEEKCREVHNLFSILGKEFEHALFLLFVTRLVGRRPRTTEQNNNSILIG